MIVVLFGQPCSGKTTLAKELKAYNIDGDKLRTVFTNKDYSKEGRIKNLNRASDIAHYLNQSVDDIRIVVYGINHVNLEETKQLITINLLSILNLSTKLDILLNRGYPWVIEVL